MTSAKKKSAQAFRTISEVATELEVPQHVLRFWESKFAQVKPMKRGGGRRYYRPEDIDLLRGIRTLLYDDGFTIKGVQKVFRERGVRFVTETGSKPDGKRPSLVKGDDKQPLNYVDKVESQKARADDAAASGSIISAVPRDLTSEQRKRLNDVLAELIELQNMLQSARGRGPLSEVEPQRAAS